MAEKIQLGDVQQSATCGICLQLLSDPRGLTCRHTYCLECLKGLQKTTVIKECPMCREMTIPSRNDLDELPVNRLARDLVKLVHTYDPSTQEAPAQWSPQPSSQLSDDFAAMLTLDEDTHGSVLCNYCKRTVVGHRFKCGICDDYDLCEECEARPRSTVHDVQHLFVKLKKPRTAPPVYKRVLHADSTLMRTSQDIGQSTHVLMRHTGRVRFWCDNCRAQPIVGTRYKCGNCDDYDLCEICEVRSESVHDPHHVFLVLRNPVGFHSTVPQLLYNFYGPNHSLGSSRPDHSPAYCDECNNIIVGHRYKCGICDDYDLCEECESKPRNAIHDVEHIFIKLKTPRTSRHANGRVLHKDSTRMSLTQKPSQREHVFKGSEGNTITFSCDHCGMRPIIGTRFKCGICSNYDLCENCEQNSQVLHKPKHVFLVLKHPVGFHTIKPQLQHNFYA